MLARLCALAIVPNEQEKGKGKGGFDDGCMTSEEIQNEMKGKSQTFQLIFVLHARIVQLNL
jgi:hypothetical protein